MTISNRNQFKMQAVDIIVDLEQHDIILDDNGDMLIGPSDTQERQMLMLCGKGDLYRYPTTGVGITEYIGAITEKTQLYDIINQQLHNDGKQQKATE